MRSLLLAALALALARPVISTGRRASRSSIAVDVSHSIASHAIEDGGGEDRRAERARCSRALADRRLRRATPPWCDTAALRAAGEVAHRRAGGRRCARRRRHRSRSGARRRARASWRPATCRASCCSATATDGGRRRSRRSRSSRRSGIPVSVEPLAPRIARRHLGRRVDLPDRSPPARSSTPRSTVGSQRDGAGESSSCDRNGDGDRRAQPAATSSVGVTRRAVTLDRVTGRAESDVDAPALRARGDADGAGRSARGQQHARQRGVGRDPRAKVLYVEGAPASARYLPARSTVPASTSRCARRPACRRRPPSSSRATSSFSATSRARRSPTRR